MISKLEKELAEVDQIISTLNNSLVLEDPDIKCK